MRDVEDMSGSVVRAINQLSRFTHVRPDTLVTDAKAIVGHIAWRSGVQRINVIVRILVAIATVLAAETFYLRPLLDARVLRIIAGERVPPEPLHVYYIVLEAVKLELILTAGVTAIRQLERRTA